MHGQCCCFALLLLRPTPFNYQYFLPIQFKSPLSSPAHPTPPHPPPLQLVTPTVFSDMKKQLKQREDGGWARVEWAMSYTPTLKEVEVVHGRLISLDPKVSFGVESIASFCNATIKRESGVIHDRLISVDPKVRLKTQCAEQHEEVRGLLPNVGFMWISMRTPPQTSPLPLPCPALASNPPSPSPPLAWPALQDDSSGFAQFTIKFPSRQRFAAYDKRGKVVAGGMDKEVAGEWRKQAEGRAPRWDSKSGGQGMGMLCAGPGQAQQQHLGCGIRQRRGCAAHQSAGWLPGTSIMDSAVNFKSKKAQAVPACWPRHLQAYRSA